MRGPVAGCVLRHRSLEQQAGFHAPGPHRLFHSCPGELVRPHVVGGAQIPHVEQREAGLGHRRDEPIRQVLVERRPAVHVGGTVHANGRADVEGVFEIAEGRCRRDAALGCRRRMLPTGHAEVEVVHHDDGDPDVAACRGEQVRSTNTRPSVAHDDDDLEVGVGELDPGGVGDRPAVESVER